MDRAVRVCPTRQPWPRERHAFDLWVAWRQYRLPPYPGGLSDQDPWIDSALRICEAEQGVIDEFIRREATKVG